MKKVYITLIITLILISTTIGCSNTKSGLSKFNRDIYKEEGTLPRVNITTPSSSFDYEDEIIPPMQPKPTEESTVSKENETKPKATQKPASKPKPTTPKVTQKPASEPTPKPTQAPTAKPVPKPTPTQKPTTPPVTKKYATIYADSVAYKREVNSTIRYTVEVDAARLFECVQAVIDYDSTKLELIRIKSNDPDIYDWEVEGPARCPNLDGIIFNANFPGTIKFNASKVAGYNFKGGKVLVNLEFIVKKEATSTIDLTIEEMTIKGDGTESYFTNGRPSITENIRVTETIR